VGRLLADSTISEQTTRASTILIVLFMDLFLFQSVHVGGVRKMPGAIELLCNSARSMGSSQTAHLEGLRPSLY